MRVTDAEIAWLLGETSFTPEGSSIVFAHSSSDEQYAPGSLARILESLRQERDGLAHARHAAETSALRLRDLENRWESEQESVRRDMRDEALALAREQVEREFVAQAEAVSRARIKLDRDRESLDLERAQFEIDRQAIEPTETALRENLERFSRERLAWERCRRQELQHLDTCYQTLLELQRATIARDRGDSSQPTAFEEWCQAKLAPIRKALAETPA